MMKIAAAHAIASSVAKRELSDEYIIPSVFNRTVFQKVGKAVAEAAYHSGAAERHRNALSVYIERSPSAEHALSS